MDQIMSLFFDLDYEKKKGYTIQNLISIYYML